MSKTKIKSSRSNRNNKESSQKHLYCHDLPNYFRKKAGCACHVTTPCVQSPVHQSPMANPTYTRKSTCCWKLERCVNRVGVLREPSKFMQLECKTSFHQGSHQNDDVIWQCLMTVSEQRQEKLTKNPSKVTNHPWTPKPWKMKVLHPQNMGYNGYNGYNP